MFQPIKISRLAVSVFEEEGQINISGHGMLKKMFLSAYLSEDKSQLEPPREHYYFNRNSHTGIDSILVRKVATYFIISDQEAESQVRLWEREFLEKVQISGQRFGHFGTFQFNEQLDFVSDSLYFYEWLPTLPYQEEKTILLENIHTEIDKPESITNGKPKRKKRVLFPALWIAMAGLFVFALFFWSKPLNLLFDKNAELSSRLVNVAPKSYSQNDTPDYFSDTHEVETTNENDELIVLGKTDDINNISDNNRAEITDDPSIAIPNVDEKNLADKVASPDEKGNEEMEKLSIESTPRSSQRCTLILGAFANPANVDKMVSKLGEYNVEAVTLKRKSLTLVGARIKCNDNPQINILKNQIEPNAWMYTH